LDDCRLKVYIIALLLAAWTTFVLPPPCFRFFGLFRSVRLSWRIFHTLCTPHRSSKLRGNSSPLGSPFGHLSFGVGMRCVTRDLPNKPPVPTHPRSPSFNGPESNPHSLFPTSRFSKSLAFVPLSIFSLIAGALANSSQKVSPFFFPRVRLTPVLEVKKNPNSPSIHRS